METRYAMVLAMLMLVPLSTAVPLGFGQDAEEAMDAALADVICRNDFAIAQMESLMAGYEGYEDLQDDIEALEADEEALADLAEDGDVEGFRAYMRETHSDNAKGARNAYVNARGQAWKGMGQGSKQEMRDEYQALHDSYQECHLSAMNSFASAKMEGYENALELARGRADNLSAKGVDTSELEDLIDEAEDEVLGGLQNEVNNAGDGNQLRQGIGKYCLFNGCPNGENFHFAARYEVKKLSAVLDAIEDEAEDAGLGDDVAQARAYLDDAQEHLDSIGPDQYSEEESWTGIKDAADAVRDILAELRSV